MGVLNEDVCGETFFVGADWGSLLGAVVYCPTDTKTGLHIHIHLAPVHSLSSLFLVFLLVSVLIFSPGMVVISWPFMGGINSASVNNRI